MFDKILKVVRITGESLNFYAIIYLEDGIYPSAITHTDFPAESGLMGFRQSAKLTEVEISVSNLVKGLSALYAYPILTITDRESLDCSHYTEMLETARIKFAEGRKGGSSTENARVIKYLH